MMLASRQVERVITPQPTIEGAGVRLLRSIGTRMLDHVDPFLLFDHFGSERPEDYLAGFPMHPHRGIETVTYMLAGEVDHRDSLGNGGTIGPGDLQWMTAGGGIMHEEMPRPRNGMMAGFQLWVNLPAKLKMSRPRYRGVAAEHIPEVVTDDGVRVRVVAGRVAGVEGAVREIYADPEYLDVTLPPASSFAQPVARGHAALAYIFEGEVTVGDSSGAGRDGPIPSPRLVVLGDGDQVRLTAGERGGRLLLISGAPLNEPIARYGPFAMNTREEIDQALRDLRAGTFIWREPSA